jgi:hypothetical protein
MGFADMGFAAVGLAAVGFAAVGFAAIGFAAMGFAAVTFATVRFETSWPAVPGAGLGAVPARAFWRLISATGAAPTEAGPVTAVAGVPAAAVAASSWDDDVVASSIRGVSAAVAAAVAVAVAVGSGTTGATPTARQPADSGRLSEGSSCPVGRSCAPRFAVAGTTGLLLPLPGVWLASTAPNEP